MDDISDEPFDAELVEAGGWSPGPYGSDDQLGTYQEVGPSQLAAAVSLLDPARPLQVFDLGQRMFPGFPAYGTRRYDAHLAVEGVDPGEGFSGEVVRPHPRGQHRMAALEERVRTTFNMGAKVNGLAHAGVGNVLYGGRRLTDVLAAEGRPLDTTTWGRPLVTRGLLIDVVAWKQEAGDDSALAQAADGTLTLADTYRITLDDLRHAMERQGLPDPGPGDAIVLRTGWSRLARDEPERYLRGSPGVWLRETRWLGSLRPALVATDSWMWGTIGTGAITRLAGACHQELIVHFGVRIGEGFCLEELAEANVDRFLFCHNPFRADGAISTNSPATAIANVAT